MDISSYLDQIIFWGGVALSALGGTSISIGAIIGWIKKAIAAAVEKLFDGKKDYDEKCKQLEAASEKCTEAGKSMITVAKQLEDYGVKLAAVTGSCNTNIDKTDALAKAIALLAANTPYLVANGVSSQINELLGITEEEVKVDEVVTNEIDG